MDIIIQAIHFTASDDLKAYVNKKIDKLERFHDKIIHTDVLMKEETQNGKPAKWVEVKMKVPGSLIVASETGDFFEEAVDLCVDKLQIQLKKHKNKT